MGLSRHLAGFAVKGLLLLFTNACTFDTLPEASLRQSILRQSRLEIVSHAFTNVDLETLSIDLKST